MSNVKAAKRAKLISGRLSTMQAGISDISATIRIYEPDPTKMPTKKAKQIAISKIIVVFFNFNEGIFIKKFIIKI